MLRFSLLPADQFIADNRKADLAFFGDISQMQQSHKGFGICGLNFKCVGITQGDHMGKAF